MSTIATKSDPEILKHCKSLVEYELPHSPVYGHLLTGSEVVFAAHHRVVLRLKVQKYHLNSIGTLHGTVIASLFDFVAGLSVASHDLRKSVGISTDMHISFVSIAKEGDYLDTEATAAKVGGSLAFTTLRVTKVEDKDKIAEGPAVANGSDTKYVRIKFS